MRLNWESEDVSAMITFEVVKEPYGWAVRRDGMMMPAWCEAAAMVEAQRMVSALHRHGTAAQMRVKSAEIGEVPGLSAMSRQREDCPA